MRADEVDEGISTELLTRSPGELPRDGGFRDDRQRLDCLNVAAFDECLSRLAGIEVDRAQRPHERRQRLHGGANDERLAVRDPSLEAAGPVRRAAAVGLDLVVGRRAACSGEREAVADLDALHGVDAHHGAGQVGIDALIDASGAVAGKHYGGPHWESLDGSKIVGAVKARADAPQASAIPWLLLSAKSVGGPGRYAQVTSVQRIHTVGGLAPARTCDASTLGAIERVPYTADYLLFSS